MQGPGLGKGSFQKLNSKRSWFRLETNIFALSFRNSKYSWRETKNTFNEKERSIQRYAVQCISFVLVWIKIMQNQDKIKSHFKYQLSLWHLCTEYPTVCNRGNDQERVHSRPCCCSASSGIQSRLGSLLCIATDALQKQNSRCHCSTSWGLMPPIQARATAPPSPCERFLP